MSSVTLSFYQISSCELWLLLLVIYFHSFNSNENRELFNFWGGVMERKPWTLRTLKCQARFFPKITPWKKERIPLYFEFLTIECSCHYFICNNTILFRENTLSWNTCNQCKILMFLSGIGELQYIFNYSFTWMNGFIFGKVDVDGEQAF